MSYVIKTKPGCDYCVKAKELLKTTGEAVEEQVYDTPLAIGAFRNAGFKTFPQVFRNGKLIGGYTELAAYLADAEDF
ncbi:hypothetical protein HGG70_07385 [Rhodobacteraceae bacterium R_SAG4]|nr:hypothetical protein [Rhodobacteraceae bacterium R_SAG4]